MPTAAAQRALPTRFNPLLQDAPPLQELIEMRRLGLTKLGEKSGNDGLFSYVHLRVALPQPLEDQEIFGVIAPELYFLMRRSKDGYVSSTGMFRASFPWARKTEEEAEKIYVKEHYQASKDETAGNLWIAPAQSLELAEEYGMRPWIEALLDNEPVMPSDHRKRNGSRDGVESDASTASAIPPSSSTRRRSTRSASPTKRMVTPRKSRAAKSSALKLDSPLKKEVGPPITEETTVTTEETTTTSTLTNVPVLTNGTAPTTVFATPLKKEVNAGTVEVDEAIETNGNIAVQTTHVKVELPQGATGPPSAESTQDMIAKARAMVAEAKKVEGESSVGGKRKVEDITIGVERGAEDVSEGPAAKKNRVLEATLRRERIKNRTLTGLFATAVIASVLPYVL